MQIAEFRPHPVAPFVLLSSPLLSREGFVFPACQRQSHAIRPLSYSGAKRSGRVRDVDKTQLRDAGGLSAHIAQPRNRK